MSLEEPVGSVAALLLMLSASAASQACAAEGGSAGNAATERAPDPPHAAFAAIPAAPISGQILGEPFSLVSARYYVDRRPGRERVDVVLSSAPGATGCAAARSSPHASLWLRRWGAQAIGAEQVRVTDDTEATWELHFERRVGGRWVGSHGVQALLELSEPGDDRRLRGALSACFAGPEASCVSGSFTATACRRGILEPLRSNAPAPDGR